MYPRMNSGETMSQYKEIPDQAAYLAAMRPFLMQFPPFAEALKHTPGFPLESYRMVFIDDEPNIRDTGHTEGGGTDKGEV